ncbi:PIN domain-containing protein [Streptomyces sp. Ru87]|uniref:PIN domain-containing protein n=1 Tax=Streptomyces sp. Ru87 TaxID=2044307 RepID=UPI00117ECD1B|nr:PIN domain-containing protein [Streptomyces sp. Ru87]
MILILDTNAVRMLNPNGSNADVLRIIAKSGTTKVAVPDMVLQEMVAQQVIEYRDAYDRAEVAVKRVRGRHPESAPVFASFHRGPDVESVREGWKRQYRAIFDLIPTTGEVAFKALVREANGEKPAKLIEKQGEKKKEGARDVAIWLSVIDYMRENPNEHVYFVTNNSRDFGNGIEWPSPMDLDVYGMEDRITLLQDMDAVISTLTEKLQASELSSEASAALEVLSQTIGELAIKELRGRSQPVSIISEFDRGGNFKRGSFRRWVAPPDGELFTVSNVTGHKIGDSVWFVADVEWLLWGVAQFYVPNRTAAPAACIWETRVLMTTSGEEKPAIVSDRPIVKRLLPEDRDKWGPIVERAVGGIDELMAGEAQNLISKQLLNYSEENRNLIANIPTVMVDDEGGDS